MNKETYIAIIVEGEKREPQIVYNMNCFFGKNILKEIVLPVGLNIYMLWKKMLEDDFETDIIEVLRESNDELEEKLKDFSREDFSEVYMFFDFDGHEKNLSSDEKDKDVVEEMLIAFDNETENGKLYISYPMIEALRDFMPNECKSNTNCIVNIDHFDKYKHESINGSVNDRLGQYSFEQWEEVLSIFSMRVSCLWNKDSMFTFEEYHREVTPMSIYEHQKEYIQNGTAFMKGATRFETAPHVMLAKHTET